MLGGTEAATFTISLPEDQTLELDVVEKRGDAGLFSILSADGRTLASLDRHRGRSCARSALIPPGATLIRVTPVTHSVGQRVFEIRTGRLHPLSASDQSRIAAEQLLSEGERITRENADAHSAIAAYLKSAGMWAALSDRSRQAYAWLQAGENEEALGDMKSAQALTQQALDLWTGAEDATCRADALRQMADIDTDIGRKPEAEVHVASALALTRSIGDDAGTTYGLVIEGGLLEDRGRIDQARADFQEALSLAEAAGKRVLQCSALTWLAELEYKQGHWRDAVRDDLRSLEIARADDERPYLALNLNDLGTNYRQMGDLRTATGYFEEALPILREVSQTRYATALYNLASAYAELDDNNRALQYLAEALPIFQKANNPRGQAYVLKTFADIYAGIGDDERAESYFREAETEWRKNSEKFGEVFALNGSGLVAARRRQFSKAIELYQQSLAIARAAGFQPQEADTLGALSDVYFSAKDLPSSLAMATQRLALARKIASPQAEALALFQQGRAWRTMHEYERAREVLPKSLALLESSGSPVEQSNVAYELASLDRDTGALDAARARILKSLDSLERAGANAGNAESRMLFATSHRKSFDLAVDVEMRMHETDRAFELSERARTRQFVDLIRGARLDIREGAEPALLDRERRVQELLNAKQERLMHLLQSSHSPSSEAQERKEIGELLQQYRDIEDEIRRHSPRYAALIAPRSLALADVQNLLGSADTALIEFWLGDERSYAWMVTGQSVQGFELLPREKIENVARGAYTAIDARNSDVEESLTDRKQRVSRADHDFAQSAAELSTMLLGGMHRLSSFRRLWIVSDGALEYLPFAALPTPGSHTPLVGEHEIVRLPSASLMNEMRSEVANRRPAPLSVAIFADPVFRSDDERLANVASRQATDPPRAASDVGLFSLPRLIFSRQEADAIRTLGGSKTREVLDFDASRAEVEKPSLRDYRVVHFATHALLDGKNPELSGLVLSLIDRKGAPEDGFLRLHEVYNLKLNADLVVLSACRTALGPEVQSEGLIGLTRGFMYAGAPQVLASLWSIRDNATTQFMKKFYEALLARHETPEAALRSAQLAMIKDDRWNQPYYWAAFTVQGVR